MLLNNYFYEAQIRRQEFEREIWQRTLVKLTLDGRGNPGAFQRDFLARLGRWLVVQGEYLETRYGQCRDSIAPAPYTANAR